MNRLAVLFICTGKYDIFWERFYRECETSFYPNNDKHYFVFTDSQTIIQHSVENVTVYYQIKTGWPYDTLLRFQWFMSIQDRLREYDVCYYFNANTTFRHIVTKEVIPFPTEDNPILLWCHPNSFNDELGESAHPERNPLSTAYIPEGTRCRCYGGGFFGGLSRAFIEMCQELRDNIQQDLTNGIIAVWHDQSHLIKYGTSHPHIEVPKGIVSEEEYVRDEEKICVVFMNKEHFGGNINLRGYSFKERIKQWPPKIYALMLKVGCKVGLEGLLRKIVHRNKGEKQ